MTVLNELDSTNGISDEELTVPIAKYDKTKKKAYLEFPDGRREYAE